MKVLGSEVRLTSPVMNEGFMKARVYNIGREIGRDFMDQ